MSSVIADFEKNVLNPVGYIPVVASFISAPIRAVIGAIQVVAGAIFAVIGLIISCALREPYVFVKGIEILTNGVGNLIRATIEFVPGLGLAICLPYDLNRSRVFRYSNE